MVLPVRRSGSGAVPATPLLAEAWKELLELPVLASAKASSLGLGKQLDFGADGVTMEQFSTFFNEALAAAKKTEPIVEAGNKYSVSSDFKTLNGELLVHELETSDAYAALSQKDQTRASKFFNFVCMNGELRNRNPLHPNHLDSAVLGNLMNFPKHIFGFPFAGYSTNGNEALSLLLFSYRSKCNASDPCVVYVTAAGEGAPDNDIKDSVERLNMKFHVTTRESLTKNVTNVAVLMASFSNPELGELAKWASANGLPVHVHVWDSELRSIFAPPHASGGFLAETAEPVHVDMPGAVRSMSLQEGLFRSAYQVYRDADLRDIHFDLPYVWQSAYISPNEGGSGNTTPLYIDFCFVMLGWSALREIAQKTCSKASGDRLQPMTLPPYGNWSFPISQGSSLEKIRDWAKSISSWPREELEKNVFQFKRNFVGGKDRTVEALVSGGGTRSGGFAFESVLIRARAALGPVKRVKLICGNPHLLVERAQRRFQFDVIRVHQDGAICIEGLKNAICDPSVAMVYTQSLSITDGITDPLHEVLRVVEEENTKRHAIGGLLVTIINDCCLALSVLIHNDGKNGSKNFRLLDLSENHITPVIVMIDAHKHLGADKGISMVMGTLGTLSNLSGHVKVGRQPSNGELARALADMLLVGVDGYNEKYRMVGAAVAETTKALADAGMTIIHKNNVVAGSTAFGVEDPSGCIAKKLKKKGHGPAPLYGLAPENPKRCQSGFLLHLTPHALRRLDNGNIALDTFVADAIECYKNVSKNYSPLAKLFSESSLPAFLLSGGNEELWLLELLRRPGYVRDMISLLMRRLYSGILDSGVICTKKCPSALNQVLKRVLGFTVLLFTALWQSRRKRLRKSKL